MQGIMQQMKERAEKCAEEIKKHSSIHVVSHIDADGLTAAGIICTALDRMGTDYSTRFVKQLDDTIIAELANQDHELVILTDIGSGMLESIVSHGLNAVVSDHHQPRGEMQNHINPHLFGANGSYELSGSGTTYILANALGDNRDLADLAIVGAMGDLQHMKKGYLTGLNRLILEEGASSNVLRFEKDLTLFGKQTRPVFKLLQFASDPYLPGLTGNEDACNYFLKKHVTRVSGDERWRRWIEYNRDEKQKVVSALVQYCLNA
ncbi:MAG: DHH family phosphoesterase, partial [Methanosarcinaceae archaeon]